MAQETPTTKLRMYLERIFPSAFTTLSLTLLPLILSGYYVITRLSDQVTNNQNLDFAEFQNNFLAIFFFSKSWVLWFNEALDFILWGAVAAVALVVVWAIGATRVAIDNHNAQTRFKHFRVSEGTWHSQFAIVAFIKILLVIIAIYCAVLILVQGVPQLGLTIERSVQNFTGDTLKQALLAGVSIFVLEYVIATCVRLFRSLRTDG